MHASPELELVRPPARGDSPFPGCVLLIAPHMDDETLGCGALMASYEWANSLHVAFATDGARSPVSRARRAEPVRELPAIRRGEAFEALRILGVAEANVHFFDLPDGELRGAHALFRDRLLALTGRLRPTTVLVPFRYDRHPDHLAVNRVTFDEALDQIRELLAAKGRVTYRALKVRFDLNDESLAACVEELRLPTAYGNDVAVLEHDVLRTEAQRLARS